MWFKERKVKTQDIRTHAKCGMLNSIDKEKKRFPEDKKRRASGVMWTGENNKSDAISIIGMGPDGKAMVVDRLYSNGKTVEPGMSKTVEQAQAEQEQELPFR